MRTPYRCLRCGLVNPMGTNTCQACGAILSGVSPPSGKGPPPNVMAPPPSTPMIQPSTAPKSRPGTNPPVAVQGAAVGTQVVASTSALSPLGWRSLDGRVIQVEPTYMANPDFHWVRLVVKLAILGATVYYYGMLILMAIGVFLLLMWLLSKVPFLSAVSVQVVSFLLTRRLMGPMANVPVRDIRIRDSAGQEFLVRIKGQLTSGSVSVGDDVLVEGWDRNGMLLFRRGFNKRIRTAIKVKHQ